MKVHLLYGTEGIDVEIPDQNLAAVLDIQPMPALDDVDARLERALAEPIGSPSLVDVCRGRESCCIVVSDVTRPVPNELMLRPILNALAATGLGKGNVAILIGTGLHRPMSREEIVESVGAEIAAEYRVENHFAKDRSTNVHLGTTPAGTPVWLDKLYVESDLKILTGLVEPHFIAGYSGGRKSICIGVAGADTIQAEHGPDFLEHESVYAGSMGENVFHHEALEIASKARADFILNITLNEEKQISGVFAGDMEAAHLEAVRYIEKFARVEVAEEADIVVTTNAGYPADINFYQSVKGMLTAREIVKPGGTIIMASRCHEHLGSEEFAELQLKTPSPEDFMRRVYEPGSFVVDQWGVEAVCKTVRKAEVLFYSDVIPDEVLAKCFVTPIASVEGGLRRALERHGPEAKVIAIPRGHYVIAEVKQQAG